MSRRRRRKLPKSEYFEQVKKEYDYPLEYFETDYIWWYFATIDLFNYKRISQDEKAREAKTHIYNRHKNKTKHRCYKLTLNKARKSGLKIPDPNLSQILHNKCRRKHCDKKQDELFKNQLKELKE